MEWTANFGSFRTVMSRENEQIKKFNVAIYSVLSKFWIQKEERNQIAVILNKKLLVEELTPLHRLIELQYNGTMVRLAVENPDRSGILDVHILNHWSAEYR